MGQSRQILFEWLKPQTQDLHGFFRRRNAPRYLCEVLSEFRENFWLHLKLIPFHNVVAHFRVTRPRS